MSGFVRKLVYVVFSLSALIFGWLAARYFFGNPENTWLCQDGRWIKQGNPSTPAPTVPCPK